VLALDAMGHRGGGNCLIIIAAAAIVVIVIVLIAVVVAVVAIRACRAYFILLTPEGYDLFIDSNESPHCRRSGNEATLETLGGKLNNGGVVIAGLALCRQ
jgi:hypothetical protein